MLDTTTCRVGDCDHAITIKSRQLCAMHYQRLRKHGSVDWEPAPPPVGCVIDDCGKEHASKGYCANHYMNLYRTGIPMGKRSLPPTTCEIDGCEVICKTTLCGVHYNRMRNHGNPNGNPETGYRTRVARVPGQICSHDGCTEESMVKGQCHRHHSRQKHLNHRDYRNEKMRVHYQENRDHYTVRAMRRQRNMTDGMTEFELDVSYEYRLAIKSDPCTYCGAPGEHNDHRFPIKLGGLDYWWNLTRACAQCNWRKAGHCETWFRLRQN